MKYPLLFTKFIPPKLPAYQVERSRLIDRINQLFQPSYRVLVISAPAGYGKTTLLAQWLQRLPERLHCGWLSLDTGDNDLHQFFRYLFAVFHQMEPSLPESYEEIFALTPELSIDPFIYSLLNQVAAAEKEFLLILDDFHVLTSADIQQAIYELVSHLPDNLRVVIAGRADPSFPMARLRTREYLFDLRAADLRFSHEEVADLFSTFDRARQFSGREEAVITALDQRVEGWAAGLQMALLAIANEWPANLQEGFIEEFAGSHQYIIDYLLEEVLDRANTDIRQFLLQTSILSTFTADLCAAVCGLSGSSASSDCQAMIQFLEKNNYFIVSVDHEHQWFRYHHLFAEVLQKQLHQRLPDQVNELHIRASAWYEAQDMVDESLFHVYCIGDFTKAQQLVEQYSLRAILQGSINNAVRWMDTLPPAVLLSSPRLCLDRAWVLTLTSKTEQATRYLEKAENLVLGLNAGETEAEADAICSEILGLRSYHANQYGQAEEALTLAQQALNRMPDSRPFLTFCGRLFLAGALAHLGKPDEAYSEYSQIHLFELSDSLSMLQADIIHDIAMLWYAAGHAQRALTALRQEIEHFEGRGKGNNFPTLLLYVGLGRLMLMENHLDEAGRLLETAYTLDPFFLTQISLSGLTALWRVRLAQGNFEEARMILVALAQHSKDRDEQVLRMVDACIAQQDFFEGRMEQVASWAARIGLSDDISSSLDLASDSELLSWRPLEFQVMAQFLLSRGLCDQAIRIYERMAEAAAAMKQPWMQVRMWVNLAVAHEQAGRHNQAYQWMEKSLVTTSHWEGNYERIYLDVGEGARSLLVKLKKQRGNSVNVDTLLAAFSQAGKVSVFKGTHQSFKEQAEPLRLDSLSEREREVLRCMAQGMRSNEIAGALYISLNTVRYHAKNIFSKLGVTNRTAAVTRAMELGILQDHC